MEALWVCDRLFCHIQTSNQMATVMKFSYHAHIHPQMIDILSRLFSKKAAAQDDVIFIEVVSCDTCVYK